jgi:hypothetical protein
VSKKETNRSRLVVESAVAKKNLIVMATAIIIFLIMATMAIVKWFVLQIYQPAELLFYVVILIALVRRVSAKYKYEIDSTCLRIAKHTVTGETAYEVPYQNIIGIYHYQPKLIGVIKFRRTYSLHSALDGREVWTLAYTVTGRQGKAEICRIYFKPGEDLLLELKAVMPDKVMVAEDVVIKKTITDD